MLWLWPFRLNIFGNILNSQFSVRSSSIGGSLISMSVNSLTDYWLTDLLTDLFGPDSEITVYICTDIA